MRQLERKKKKLSHIYRIYLICGKNLRRFFYMKLPPHIVIAVVMPADWNDNNVGRYGWVCECMVWHTLLMKWFYFYWHHSRNGFFFCGKSSRVEVLFFFVSTRQIHNNRIWFPACLLISKVMFFSSHSKCGRTRGTWTFWHRIRLACFDFTWCETRMSNWYLCSLISTRNEIYMCRKLVFTFHPIPWHKYKQHQQQ